MAPSVLKYLSFLPTAVVEMLASGLITLAHRSGGPLMDIVLETEQNRNGFLAVHEDEYADAILQIVDLNGLDSDSGGSGGSGAGLEAIRSRARSSVERFSEREFDSCFVRATETLINGCVRSRES